jgi:PAS domain S-box-containing protein
MAITTDAALARLRDTRIDLIVLDYKLNAGINGLDFLAEIRAGGWNVPVILVTGFSTEGVVIRALRAGVRDLVPKTSDHLHHLRETVDRVLREVRTERRLAESEARLASIIESVHDAIVVAGPDFRITFFNGAAEEMFRCPAEQAIGRQIDEFLAPEVFAAKDQSHLVSIRTRFSARHGQTLWGRRADGEQFPIEASASRAGTADQTFYTAVVRDVTEREQAAAKIQKQAALLDEANDAISVRDPAGNVVFWNRGAERLYGWTRAEAVSGTLAPTLDAISFLGLHEANQAISTCGEWSGEIRHVRHDGQEVIVASRWARLRGPDEQPEGTLVIDTDVTERKLLEAQYLHAQKLDAVGHLAGGMAHDFNNLLTIIIGYGELLLASPALPDDARETVRGILGAGERGVALILQLLTFSRRQVVSPRVLDLNRLIPEAERMFQRLIGVNVELTTDLAPDLGRVKGDPGQIEQVLLNLAVNARDAMPTGGRLTIETRNIELDSGYARRHVAVRPGAYVRVRVRDTGHGMDAETLSRAFEPFFTTKEIGKGTGLGLAAVHGIVTQAGGHVDLSSEVGRGTTVSIYFPRVPWEPETDSGIVSVQAPRGVETILIAEDDDKVRALARAALMGAGYTVLDAACGDEAMLEAAAFPGPIHLLVTDMMMPGVGGRELAERLTKARPGVKVLFMSGHPDEQLFRNPLADPKMAFLQKPFTRVSLARKIRQILDVNNPSEGNTPQAR